MEDLFRVGGREFQSRLLLGTGKFANYAVMKKAIEESGSDIVTVALRRVDPGSQADNILIYPPPMYS